MKGSEEKMKKARQNGFVLILVIIVLAIIGVEMFVLTDSSNTMMFQANKAYLKACERNLKASGLAWAKRNIQNKSRENFDKTVELDVGKMNILGSRLKVNINTPRGKETQVQVETMCSQGRQTFRDTKRYQIKL